MKEVGTLKELDVKPGDVVECVWKPIGGVFTVGKTYRMTNKGLECDADSPQLSTVSTFRIISRASDKPKLWRDMTDAEKGALLLSAHEGKVIEFYSHYVPEWKEVAGNPNWSDNYAYRVRPEPKVETVTINYWEVATDVLKNHRITFNTIDGKPDCASIKMEAL